jgi:hypothetical protein
MATTETGAMLTADEAATLIDLIGTYMAGRCSRDGSEAIVPKAHELTLEFALRKLEETAGFLRENYDYWRREDCDGSGDLRHI